MSHHHRPDSATCSGCTNIKKLLSTLLGIDRLLMALTGQGIRETILFPLVKPAQ